MTDVTIAWIVIGGFACLVSIAAVIYAYMD